MRPPPVVPSAETHADIMTLYDMTVVCSPPEELSKMKFPSSLTVAPPNIYQWLCQLLHRTSSSPFPYLPGVSEKTKNVIAVTIQIH